MRPDVYLVRVFSNSICDDSIYFIDRQLVQFLVVSTKRGGVVGVMTGNLCGHGLKGAAGLFDGWIGEDSKAVSTDRGGRMEGERTEEMEGVIQGWWFDYEWRPKTLIHPSAQSV